MSDDKKPLVVPVSAENEDWLRQVQKNDKTADKVAARFKSAAKMDVHGRWNDIVDKYKAGLEHDFADLIKELVPYFRSVGYDLDVSKSYLGVTEHGSDGMRRTGQFVITERAENTTKASSPQKVAMWVEQATGLHGSARRMDGDTWMVDVDEN